MSEQRNFGPFVASILTVLTIGSGVLVWSHYGDRLTADHITADDKGPSKASSADKSKSADPADKQAAFGHDIAAADQLEETSWQDPFDEKYWTTKGWQFESDSMSSVADKLCVATFHRKYRKLMFEAEVTPVGKQGTLEIELFAPNRNALVSTSLTTKRITVSAKTRRQQGEIRRRDGDFTIETDAPGRLRVAATGNRILIFWNNQRVLACNQPAQQSGQPMTITLVAPSAGWRINKMRLEGE
jgi:hypothetical protein